MLGSSSSRRLFLPSLAAELPEGWSVSEGATFESPSGTNVHARLSRAPDGWDASDLASQMETAARAELAGADVVHSSTVQLRDGRLAHERRVECIRDGVESVCRIVCLVEGGLAVTLTTSWPASGGPAETDLDEVLASLRLLSRPVADVPAGPGAPGTSVGRAPVDAATWSILRTAWSSPNPREVQLRSCSRWSATELAVCATILGAASFPTVGTAPLGHLPAGALSATLDAVTRSFLARGLVRAGVDGVARLSDDLCDVIEVAVFPDLTISIESVGTTGLDHRWYGIRPGCAVQVSVLPDGSRECAQIEPGDVVAQLLDLRPMNGSINNIVTGADPIRVTPSDLARGAGPLATLARVCTAWRAGEQIRGGVFTWGRGKDGSHWLAEIDSEASVPAWELRPTDAEGLRAHLLDHLPGI